LLFLAKKGYPSPWAKKGSNSTDLDKKS
jgi:hypothetical protein